MVSQVAFTMWKVWFILKLDMWNIIWWIEVQLGFCWSLCFYVIDVGHNYHRQWKMGCFYNIWCNWRWKQTCECAEPLAKADLSPMKVLTVWWECRGIIHSKFLTAGKTIAKNKLQLVNVVIEENSSHNAKVHVVKWSLQKVIWNGKKYLLYSELALRFSNCYGLYKIF